MTVGTELPFDRLVRPIDQWAGRTGRKDIFAQIGPSTLRPEHIEWANFIDAAECRKRIADASVVIAHAGMGTILIARELGKPILVMPRRAAMSEHRTDHQLGTVRELAARNAIVPVMDEYELMAKLDNLDSFATATDHISPFASTDFLNKIRSFIELGVISVGADEVVKSPAIQPSAIVRGGRAFPAMGMVKSPKSHAGPVG